VQSTKVVHIRVQIEWRQQLLKFQNSELFICMRWHQIVRLFLAICQEPVHSESEAMPKHLLASSTWFRKVVACDLVEAHVRARLLVDTMGNICKN
jgi:hypothetical protein